MRGEPDRYLAATLAPPEVRPALAAIAAFAAEVARIPATVSETMLGEIRLQWWRDALAEGREGRRSGHPVTDALVDAAGQYDLPADLIEAVIEARERDLSGGLPQDDAGLAAHLRATEGNVFLLGLCVLGAQRSDVEALASSAGHAYGIARGLCRLPMLLHNGGLILPSDRLRAAGVDPALLASRPAEQGVNEAVRRVADELGRDALDALSRARELSVKLEKRYRSVLLPLAMVEPYFRAQSSRRILVEAAELSPMGRVVRIGLAHLMGRW